MLRFAGYCLLRQEAELAAEEYQRFLVAWFSDADRIDALFGLGNAAQPGPLSRILRLGDFLDAVPWRPAAARAVAVLESPPT